MMQSCADGPERPMQMPPALSILPRCPLHDYYHYSMNPSLADAAQSWVEAILRTRKAEISAHSWAYVHAWHTCLSCPGSSRAAAIHAKPYAHTAETSSL